MGCRAGPPAYVAWQAGIRQPYAIVDYIPQSEGLRIWRHPEGKGNLIAH